MPFITTLALRSGDRETLDRIVGEIRRAAERKGIEFKGPHTHPPGTYRVPLYRRTTGDGGTYPPWEYTVYERELTLGGHDESVRRIAEWDLPRGVHVEMEIEQIHPTGRR